MGFISQWSDTDMSVQTHCFCSASARAIFCCLLITDQCSFVRHVSFAQVFLPVGLILCRFVCCSNMVWKSELVPPGLQNYKQNKHFLFCAPLVWYKSSLGFKFVSSGQHQEVQLIWINCDWHAVKTHGTPTLDFRPTVYPFCSPPVPSLFWIW